jgi:hypothetical protein
VKELLLTASVPRVLCQAETVFTLCKLAVAAYGLLVVVCQASAVSRLLFVLFLFVLHLLRGKPAGSHCCTACAVVGWLRMSALGDVSSACCLLVDACFVRCLLLVSTSPGVL